MTWRKSSFSLDNATCVEVSASAWRKSSFCDTSACVEVNFQTSSYCAQGECVEVSTPAFRKATASSGNGACVQVSTPNFRKARRSADTANCVEVADCGCGGDVLIRDSKDPDGPWLSVPPAVFGGFLAAIKAGEFDRTG